MSGRSWSYNRFDEYEAKLKAQKEAEAAAEETTEEQIQERLDDMPKGGVGHERHQKAMADNSPQLTLLTSVLPRLSVSYW